MTILSLQSSIMTITMMQPMTVRERMMSPRNIPLVEEEQSAKRIILCPCWKLSSMSDWVSGTKPMEVWCSCIWPMWLHMMYQIATTMMLNSIEKG